MVFAGSKWHILTVSLLLGLNCTLHASICCCVTAVWYVRYCCLFAHHGIFMKLYKRLGWTLSLQLMINHCVTSRSGHLDEQDCFAVAKRFRYQVSVFHYWPLSSGYSTQLILPKCALHIYNQQITDHSNVCWDMQHKNSWQMSDLSKN